MTPKQFAKILERHGRVTADEAVTLHARRRADWMELIMWLSVGIAAAVAIIVSAFRS